MTSCAANLGVNVVVFLAGIGAHVVWLRAKAAHGGR